MATPDGKNWKNLPPDHPAVGPSYPEKQLESLVNLLVDIVRRNNLSADAILTKQDVAPNRRRSDLYGTPLQDIRDRVKAVLAD